MNAVFAGTLAGIKFAKSLFARTHRVSGRSGNGYSVMEGWNGCPEERTLEKWTQEKNRSRGLVHALLVGLEGQHAGERLSLRQPLEILSADFSATKVITPLRGDGSGCVRIFLGDSVKATADSKSVLKVNGQPCQEAELFDYDEIEVLGNRFLLLVLDKKGAVV